MAQVATKLYEARRKPCRLSPFVFMTDPTRVPDVLKAAKAQPEGAAIIYRHFGKADKLTEAESLRQITFAKSQQLLIGNDPKLAISVGADGVHFKRDAKLIAPTLWRQRCPNWIISMAGIKTGDHQGDLSVLDALLVSSVFKSQSSSAGVPMGIDTFKALTKELPVPVYALGGVNKNTAKGLVDSGAAGLSGIGFEYKSIEGVLIG